MENIFNEIKIERERQEKKWGEQNHPSVDVVLSTREGGCSPQRMCEHYEIPSENRAKFLCDNSARNGDITYTHIIVEELSEAVSCPDDISRREELVQLAACVVAWIQSIDRKIKSNG